MKKYIFSLLSVLFFVTAPLFCAQHNNNLLKGCQISNFPTETISAIIAAGACINYYDFKKNTALHYACISENEAAVKLLLHHKNINVNQQNNLGNTPLIIACSKNNKNIVQLLLAYPYTKSSLKNNQGNTALHIAAYLGYEEIVKILCNHHEYNPILQNNRAKTALDMAHEGQETNCITLLTTQATTL